MNYHDVTIMGFAGMDEQKGKRNVKIVNSIFANLRPHINTTETSDHRIVLHRHSFMSYVRDEGRRYQYLKKKNSPFSLQLNITKIIQECFIDVNCDGICCVCLSVRCLRCQRFNYPKP